MPFLGYGLSEGLNAMLGLSGVPALLAPSATSSATKDPKIAGLPNDLVN